ncbi:hypothetical protein [Paraburkholderia tropica]|uniref:hypothetical protein n=1 Tax=Paraburkholderia tropica TaxID=92647 RepID=UPI003D2A8A26
MSTIAWDGETLAADRCSWSGCARRRSRKVFALTRADGSKVLVGFTGSQSFSVAVMDWMQGKGEKPDCKEFGVEPDNQCAIVVDEKLRVWTLGNKLQYCRMIEKIFALGGGQEFAWGALEAGATAKRAIEIAAKRGDYAGLGVDCVRF